MARKRTRGCYAESAGARRVFAVVGLLLPCIGMKYALHLVGTEPVVVAETSVGAVVASPCRVAALDFMAGVAEGWTKFDLALWLHGPYALATRLSQPGLRVRRPNERAIEVAVIDDLLMSARGHVIAALERAMLADEPPDFVEDALVRCQVCLAVDDDGRDTWVPVDGDRIRLRDRVASLFAADYLNAPDDYEELYVCHHCESVVFEPGAKERGMCAAHTRVSGIYARRAPVELPLVRRKRRTRSFGVVT